MAFSSCLLLVLAAICAATAQDLFLERPISVVVDLGSPSRLNCSVNASVFPVEWRRGQTVLAGGEDGLTVTSEGLRIAATGWEDIGQYSCVATFRSEEFSASATINITGYVKPYLLGTYGFGAISSDDRKRVQCPIGGTPGPELVYWVNKTTGMNVTTDTSVKSGLFVTSEGELDLSRGQLEDSGFYVCVGVDPTGNSFNTTFRIDIVEEEDGLTPFEWYFILVYCVVAVLVLLLICVAVYICYTTRAFCFVKVAQTKVVRTRIRREKPEKIVLDEADSKSKEVYP